MDTCYCTTALARRCNQLIMTVMQPSPFSSHHLDALAAIGRIRSYPRHTLLIQEGDHRDQIYVVLSGRLKVYLSDSEGKEIIIDTLGPKQCFGEMALEGEPRSSS